eukprot:GHVO01064742.1.p1 GENE.GHVO01064742.1~~GHVO01064742.1.p1  ORF type:complete len:200 (-),score=21.43 GHVO01064742.1:313-912(-)
MSINEDEERPTEGTWEKMKSELTEWYATDMSKNETVTQLTDQSLSTDGPSEDKEVLDVITRCSILEIKNGKLKKEINVRSNACIPPPILAIHGHTHPILIYTLMATLRRERRRSRRGRNRMRPLRTRPLQSRRSRTWSVGGCLTRPPHGGCLTQPLQSRWSVVGRHLPQGGSRPPRPPHGRGSRSDGSMTFQDRDHRPL